MNTIRSRALGFLGVVTVVAGCASNPPPPTPVAAAPQAPTSPYPDYVLNPVIENGLASAPCVPLPAGNIGAAQKHATANGRADIAMQIGAKVKAMDKTYDRIANTNEGASTGGTFESVSKQVTEQHLQGVRAVKFDPVTDGDKRLLCALITLSPEYTDSLFKGLVKQAGVNLAPDSESVLREQFMAWKAEKAMDEELGKQSQR
jgi:hypothetical protein